MQVERAQKTDLRPLLAVGLLVAWAIAYNALGMYTWGYGKLGFWMLVTLATVVGAAKIFGLRLAVSPGQPSKALVVGVSVAAGVVIVASLVSQISAYSADLGANFHNMDISENTFRADNFYFVYNQNPYMSNAQVYGNVDAGPHISEKDGLVLLYGVPYYKGYPYFPAMFLTYDPFRRMDSSRDYIREGNLLFYLLLLAEIGWLSALLAPAGYKVLAGLLSVAAFTCSLSLGQEVFYYGVTDIVIPLYALAGFIAIRYGRHSIGGALLGLCLACKILPGGFFVLALALWYWRKPERWKFLIPMVATFVVVMLPFVLPNPGAFLSATILFYLTFHASGDDTALYYFLPASLQPIFQIIGYAAVIVFIFWAGRRRSLGLTGVIAICFISDIVFTAFNRMAHLNYLWGVAPLGAVALVVAALGGQVSGADLAEEKGGPKQLFMPEADVAL